MPRLGKKVKHTAKSRVGTDVGIAADKPGLVVFYAGDHRSLLLDGLRTIDEGYSALLSEGNRHRIIGYCLHNRGGQRYVHRERRLLIAMKFDQRRTQ